MIRWARLDPNERYGAPVLIRELGLWRALVVGRAVRKAAKSGAPFDTLPPPRDRREEQSRAQIGPAVLLYRVLLESQPQAEALRICGEVAAVAGRAFLAEQLGRLRRDDVAKLDEAGREHFARTRGERFFNADLVWNRIDGEAVEFTVTHCSFPGLCAAAGAPELAPIFCEVDRRYFGTVEPDVLLDRPQTIAAGAGTCEFRLSYRERGG